MGEKNWSRARKTTLFTNLPTSFRTMLRTKWRDCLPDSYPTPRCYPSPDLLVEDMNVSTASVATASPHLLMPVRSEKLIVKKVSGSRIESKGPAGI